jgi:hypothetical protein
MPSRDELQRIAALMNVVRPAWRIDSLLTYLTKHHAGRAYGELAVAALVVAMDERTKTPALLAQHGHWWTAAFEASRRGGTPIVGPGSEPRCTRDGHEFELARHCRWCRAEDLAGENS